MKTVNKLKKKIIKKFAKGFTLVELLAIIVILAIIMIVAIPATLDYITVSKKKTFIEYVDKIYQSTRTEVANLELKDEEIDGCKVFYIKKDLNLANTGEFDGFVLVKVGTNDDYEYYIVMHDDDYTIPVHQYDGKFTVNDLKQYKSDEELTVENICNLFNCTNCVVEIPSSCDDVSKVSDSNPGKFNGEGTAKNPYKIESVEDLVALSVGTNNGSLPGNKYYILATHLFIDCDKSYVKANNTTFGDVNGDGTVSGLMEELTTGKGFTPIGTQSRPFTSHLNGNNRLIDGLYINTNSDLVGLIGYATSSDYILENLSLTNANISNTGNYTGIAVGGAANGKLFEIKTYGSLKCGTNCGGVVGSYINGSLKHLTNNATIVANGENIGGVVGSVSATSVISATNNGSLEFNPSATLANFLDSLVGRTGTLYNDFLDKFGSGGVIGTSTGSSLNEVYNNGNIKSNSKACNMGGIVGFMMSGSDNIIYNATNNGEIVSSSNSTGGIVGRSIYATLYDVYNHGNITFYNYGSSLVDLGEIPYVSSIFGSLENSLGGVVGFNSGNSYLINAGNTGNITTDGKGYVGGVIGKGDGIIHNVYNDASITSDQAAAGELFIGGIAGYGSAVDAYSYGDIIINKYCLEKSLIGSLLGDKKDPYTVGLAIGATLSNYNNSNIYAVGSIINNYTGSVNYGTNYGGLFGYMAGANLAVNKNFFGRVDIIGIPNVSLFSGNNFSGNVDNIYVDMYTNAKDVRDVRTSSSSWGSSGSKVTYTNFYGNLNTSPYKKTFTKATQYNFDDVNTNWFRDTLNLGDKWYFEDGKLPLLKRVNMSGSVSDELVKGQKKHNLPYGVLVR